MSEVLSHRELIPYVEARVEPCSFLRLEILINCHNVLEITLDQKWSKYFKRLSTR